MQKMETQKNLKARPDSDSLPHLDAAYRMTPKYACDPTSYVGFEVMLNSKKAIYHEDYAPDSNFNMASGVVTPHYSAGFQVYDALGTSHSMVVDFLKTGNNLWAVEVASEEPKAVALKGEAAATGLLAFGNVTFNGDGTLQQVSGSISKTLEIHWTNGALDSKIELRWGKEGETFYPPDDVPRDWVERLTQVAAYSQSNIVSDGTPVSGQSRLILGDDGIVMMSYHNGATRPFYELDSIRFESKEDVMAALKEIDSPWAYSDTWHGNTDYI